MPTSSASAAKWAKALPPQPSASKSGRLDDALAGYFTLTGGWWKNPRRQAYGPFGLASVEFFDFHETTEVIVILQDLHRMRYTFRVVPPLLKRHNHGE